MKLIFHIRVFAISVCSIACFSCNETAPTDNARQRSLLNVDAIVVNPTRFENQFISTATILPFEEVELRAPVSGTVLSIHFEEGRFVKDNQPLVRLDDRSLKAQINSLEVQLGAAESDLNRKKQLLAVEGVSEEDVENSQAIVDGLKARIEELLVNIRLANIRAPFAGKVGLRNFSVGSYLNQGQAITSLVQTQKLKVDFNIGSRYLDEVKVGSKITVISSGDSLIAEVYAISPLINSNSRTAQVRAFINNNTKGFIPGDFAEVVISLNVDSEALVVPTNVIVAELNTQTLYIYKAGRAIRKEVLLGARTDSDIQILSGIESGDTVLTTGLIQVKDQMPVNVSVIQPTGK